MVDFTFSEIITVVADSLFNGSTTIAGLSAMVVLWLVIVAVLANIKAPISYSLVPMIPIAIIFAGFNIISTDISMIIILICSVMTAITFRDILGR